MDAKVVNSWRSDLEVESQQEKDKYESSIVSLGIWSEDSSNIETKAVIVKRLTRGGPPPFASKGLSAVPG